MVGRQRECWRTRERRHRRCKKERKDGGGDERERETGRDSKPDLGGRSHWASPFTRKVCEAAGRARRNLRIW